MRIAIFTDTFLPQVDGVVTVTVTLAEHLADRGHKVYIIAPKYKRIREYHHKNVIVKRMPSIPALFYDPYRLSSFISIGILRYLKKEKVEIIHFQTPITLGLQALIVARILDLPVIGTYHTLISDPQYLRHVKLSSSMAQRISWKYAALYYNRCALVTCPTNVIRKKLRRHFKRPVITISNGIAMKGFSNTHAKQLKLKYNPNGKLLLFVGRIAYEKNIQFLLDCFSRIRKQSPSTKLIMVGDGPQMADLRAQITHLGLGRAIILTGSIPHAQLVKSGIFGACDIFVTASTTETQGISMLEALANGVPAIGIRAEAVTEVIRNGYNGYLVKNKTAFVRATLKLLQNDTLRRKMSRQALRSMKAHDLGNITRMWEKQYATLIARKGRK